MTVWDILLQFLPHHWPKSWDGSFHLKDGGPETKVKVTKDSITFSGALPTIEFTFENAGSTQVLRAVGKDTKGDVDLFLDGVQKKDHTMLHAGVAVKPLQGRTDLIIHFAFVEGTDRRDYRFEGRVN